MFVLPNANMPHIYWINAGNKLVEKMFVVLLFAKDHS